MALTVSIPETAWKKCCPHVVEDFDRCGGISVCSVKPIMPDEWDTIYLDNGMPRVDSALAEADFVGKSCLPKSNGLYDFISATRRQWSRGFQGNRKRMDGTLEYEPFIKMSRKGPINNQWWTATYGGVLAGTPPAPDQHIFVVESLSDSIPANVQWFPPGIQVFFSGRADDKKTVIVAGLVRDAQIVGEDLKIWVEMSPGDAAPGSGGSAVNVKSVLTRGVPNVSDYESYCPILPALNTNQEAYFWVGTTRYSVCDSEVQNEFIQRVLKDNKLYRQFIHVPDVEYTRQVTEDFQRRMVEQFFYGKAWSDKQNKDEWDELPQITLDYGEFLGPHMIGQDTCIGRKANPVGVVSQLNECNRVRDYGGTNNDAPFDLTDLFEEIYAMQRVRAENGVESNIFEVCMNTTFARMFQMAMIKYYKAQTADTLSMNWDLGAQKQGPFGFYFRDFVLDFPAGVILRVMTHPFFDDWADAHRQADAAITQQGNIIWMIDWSTIYQAIISSNSVTNKTGDVQEMARVSAELLCIMKTKQTTYRHTSTTFTNVVECPGSSLMIWNIPYLEPVVGPQTFFGMGRIPWDDNVNCDTVP